MVGKRGGKIIGLILGWAAVGVMLFMMFVILGELVSGQP